MKAGRGVVSRVRWAAEAPARRGVAGHTGRFPRQLMYRAWKHQLSFSGGCMLAATPEGFRRHGVSQWTSALCPPCPPASCRAAGTDEPWLGGRARSRAKVLEQRTHFFGAGCLPMSGKGAGAASGEMVRDEQAWRRRNEDGRGQGTYRGEGGSVSTLGEPPQQVCMSEANKYHDNGA